MLKKRLSTGWFGLCFCMVTFSVLSTEAAEPIADTPFIQEYRDPFVKGKTREENDVRAVAVDSAGHVWAATAAGLMRVEKGKLNKLADDTIDGPAYDVSVDKNGTVWVGAWNGVYRIDGSKIVSVAGLKGPITVVSPIGTRLLVGSPAGVHERTGETWKHIPGPWATSVRDIAIADDSLYVAAWSGIFRKQGATTEWLSRRNQILSRNARALAVGSDGRLWIGTRGGINVYRGGRPERIFTGKEGLPSTDVRSLNFDDNGTLWVGTRLGVARFDGRKWSLRHSLRWLPNDEVRDVAFDSDGTAWVATRDGISAIRRRTMTLADKAAFYQELVRSRHVRAPGLVERCRLRTPGEISTWEPMDTDNDGMYTGFYLVGEAYRFAVTGAADAKANATEAYRAIEFLQTVTDTPGFFARTVVPSDWTHVADANRTHTPQQMAERYARESRAKHVKELWRKSRDGKLLWKGDTSSDETSGHFYAYGVYYDLVADAKEKKRVAAHVKKIMDYMIDGGYVFRDIDGKSTRWAVWAPENLNDDPNWWLEKGGNSVEILSYLTVAYHMTGDEKYQREIDKLLYEHHYAENIMVPMQPGSDYFTYIGYNLLALSYPALMNYEKDPKRLALYRKSMEAWFAPVRRDASPLYSYVYNTHTGGKFRRQQCVEQLREVPLDMIQWTVNNTQREDVKLVERPVEGLIQTDRLLPADERSVFRWDRNVYQADRGAGGRTESSSAYWLTPYWMGRYFGYIAAPEKK